MPRRFNYARRRMALESLEVRCNPSAVDPGTSILIEPATQDAGEAAELEQVASNQGQAEGASTNVEVFVTVTDTESSADAPDKRGVGEVSLNSFAGQTVRLRIAAVNNRGQLIVGVADGGVNDRLGWE